LWIQSFANPKDQSSRRALAAGESALDESASGGVKQFSDAVARPTNCVSAGCGRLAFPAVRDAANTERRQIQLRMKSSPADKPHSTANRIDLKTARSFHTASRLG
jgi:hypothetical protein